MKKRVSIFGRKDMSGKPPWGEDGGVLETVGEGFFWKKGQSIPHNWRRRDYKLRSDAMLFYFDGGKLRGCADLTDISICAGNDKNADKAGAASQQAIPVDLFSVSESKNFELVFGGKDSTDAFCMQLMKVTANTAGVEKFVRDFHWKEANRLLGEYEMDDEDDCERATTMTSVAGEVPDGKFSWEEGTVLAIIGDGEFWKKGQRVKNWKRRIYKIREDGMMFYFEAGKNKPKGCRDVTSATFSIGADTNLSDSGATDFCVEDAVPVSLSFDNDGSRFMELVFDSVTSAKMFALAVSKAASKHNVLDFIDVLQRPEDLPRFDESRVAQKPTRRGSSLSTVDGEVLLLGQWLKRGRVRNVMKKRDYRIISRKDGSTARPAASQAIFEYMYGESGYFKKSIDVYHILLRFEPGTSAAIGSLDFSEGEVVPMQIIFLNVPIAHLNDSREPCASSVDTTLQFALEGLAAVENFCTVLQGVALSSNIPAFLTELRDKEVIRVSAKVVVETPLAVKIEHTSSRAAAVLVAPSSTDYTIVYEGVFIKRTKVVNSWKSRGFKLKKSSETSGGEMFAQLEYKGFGAFITKVDISDITLALMEGHIKIDGGVGDYTQFSITSNIEKERIDVAMFGRHDVDVFCNYLTQICRVHNVEDFLTEFHNSPLGRKRKKIYTYLRGTFLRQGLRTHNWKRKQYRICRVEDSTVEPPVEYGVLQFGPENVKPTDWMGYVILKDINLLIDSTISAGSDAIIIKANDASSAPIDENHRKLILILDPHSCHEGYSARRERIRAERDIAGNDNSDDDDSIGESAEEDYLEEVEEVTGGVPQRVHPSLHEISTFLMAIHKRAAKSNAEELLEQFGSRSVRRGMGEGKAAILFYICSGLLVFSSLWVIFMPSLPSLTVLAICIALMGVFVGNNFSTRKPKLQ